MVPAQHEVATHITTLCTRLRLGGKEREPDRLSRECASETRKGTRSESRHEVRGLEGGTRQEERFSRKSGAGNKSRTPNHTTTMPGVVICSSIVRVNDQQVALCDNESEGNWHTPCHNPPQLTHGKWVTGSGKGGSRVRQSLGNLGAGVHSIRRECTLALVRLNFNGWGGMHTYESVPSASTLNSRR